MKKIFLIVLLYSTITNVFATDPITVSKNVTIADVKLETLWRWTGGFCTIRVWHPAVKKCEITKEGDAEFRILTLADGGVIKEQHTGGKVYGYSYKIISGPFPVKDYTSNFEAEDKDGSVEFTWTATFLADGKTDAEAEEVIAGVLGGGLDSIAKKYAKKKKHKKDKDEE